MQSLKRTGRTAPERRQPSSIPSEDVEPDDDSTRTTPSRCTGSICPDCAQPIALLADEDVLPEHALCPTPWNPFVLTVCAGTGRRGGRRPARGRDLSPRSRTPRCC